ncbi:hypothetical protein ERHA55_30340 [Erwinia rhapontici]|nr:hypothetical protein ERHA55_30340 [Erwinia rhapontici]
MFLTDYLIILFIVLIFLYGLYDELIMDRLQGPTRLKVLLQRRNKLDSLIFIVLLVFSYTRM